MHGPSPGTRPAFHARQPKYNLNADLKTNRATP
jgi:hypothetical protein